jgi:hypothetical protein
MRAQHKTANDRGDPRLLVTHRQRRFDELTLIRRTNTGKR